MTERYDYGMVLPDRITLFQKSIEEICSGDDEVINEVRNTVAHEVAHHFGIDDERLDELGCEADFDGWYCGAEVPRVALFCNGPWCGQSPTAIRRMIDAGYPADKIAYYRGGMQVWRLLGLTVTGEDG